MLKLLDIVNYKIDNRIYQLTNICEAYVLKRLNIDKTYLYKDYFVQADSTPESISNEVYKTVKYWWVIMIVNNMVNPFYDLPMSHDILVEYCKVRYGSPDVIHHFYDETINRYCDDVDTERYLKMHEANQGLPVYIRPVTVLENEIELNNKRARIKIVNPQFVSVFEEIFTELTDEN